MSERYVYDDGSTLTVDGNRISATPATDLPRGGLVDRIMGLQSVDWKTSLAISLSVMCLVAFVFHKK